VLTTGENGEAILLFADGLELNLGPSTVLNVNDYRFIPGDNGQNRAVVTIQSGMVRASTGAMHAGNPDSLTIRANNAEIRVPGLAAATFVLSMGNAGVAEVSLSVITGNAVVRPAGGPAISVPQGQYTRIQSGASVVQLPLTAAPAIVQAMSRVQSVSDGNPVNLAAAAELAKLLGTLPASAAGPAEGNEQNTLVVVFPAVTPAFAGGCVGSPC
jgi:hypothetical protein